MKYLLPLIFIGAVALSVVLGFTINSFLSHKSASPIKKYRLPTSYQKQTTVPSQPPSSQKGPKETIWYNLLNNEEKVMFEVPSHSSSDAERKKRLDLIKKYATPGNTIVITHDCRPFPLVLLAKNQSSIVVQNQDANNSHTIHLGKDNHYLLAAYTNSPIQLGLVKDNKILSYGCDSFNFVGFLVLGP